MTKKPGPELLTSRIYLYPHENLRKVCTLVSLETDEEKQEAKDLADKLIVTMLRHQAAGLAAPQIGFDKRMFCIQMNGKPQIFCNPKILDESPERQTMTEGCLSIPNARIKLSCRSEEILVGGVDQFGEEIKAELSEVEAVAFQHELDHLRGVTILDIVPKGVQRTLALGRLKKFKKQVRKSDGHKNGTSAFIL